MDTARQIIRWSIPGWCFFIFLIFFIGMGSGITAIFTRNFSALSITALINFFPSIFLNATTVLLLGFAGIPIGYIIYQVYFYLYWRGIWTPWGFVIDQDKGFLVLNGIDFSDSEKRDGLDTKLEKLPKSISWSLDRVVPSKLGFLGLIIPSFHYIPRSRLRRKNGSSISSFYLAQMLSKNWAKAVTVWYRFAIIPSHRLEYQVSYIFDVFHSQGAVRTALAIAYALYVIHTFTAQLSELLHYGRRLLILEIALNTLLFLLLFKVLTALRRINLATCIEIMRQTIRLRNHMLRNQNRLDAQQK